MQLRERLIVSDYYARVWDSLATMFLVPKDCPRVFFALLPRIP